MSRPQTAEDATTTSIFFRGMAGIALALAWVTTPLGASADTTLIVGKAAPNAEAIIPVNIGDRLGIFKKRGLDVKIVDFAGGSKMVQALTAGSIDIADGDGSQMAFVAKGVPMIAVCEDATTLPYTSVGVPWDSPIKTKDDLKGKKIGVSAAGSMTDWLAQEFVRKQGWEPDDILRVMIGSGSSAAAAFHDHQIDAYIGGTTTFLTMAEKQVGRVLFPVSDYVGHMASGTLYASDRLIATNPDAIRSFLAGWLETTAFIRTHKAETVKIESDITGFSESVMAQEYDIVNSMYSEDCKFDAESLATLRRSFIDLNTLDEPPDMSKLYTEAYLPTAPITAGAAH
jgi:NitT/TauT family transport system substrate-binding protein